MVPLLKMAGMGREIVAFFTCLLKEPRFRRTLEPLSTQLLAVVITYYEIFSFVIFSQEFGEGARARRMYENDSDDEENEEEEDLEPNPKLAQGTNI